jgi:hypothetical protein
MSRQQLRGFALRRGPSLLGRALLAWALVGWTAAGWIIAGGAATAATTLYRWVDAQGVVHYSDSPQPGAETVTVQPPQTYRAPSTSNAGQSNAQASGDQQPSPSYQCQVTAPMAEESFYAPEAVSIVVSVQPALHPEDRLVVALDGKVLPESSSGEFEVPEPDRGSHTVTAVIRGADGRDTCVSAPVTFYVQRPSVNSPQSPARGR